VFAIASVLLALVGSASLSVVDTSEAVLPGTLVQLFDSTGQVSTTSLADSQGIASFSRLIPGRYRAKIQLDGFVLREVEFSVTPGSATFGRVVLEVATIPEVWVYEPPRTTVVGPRCEPARVIAP
jgi:hypothetical protein